MHDSTKLKPNKSHAALACYVLIKLQSTRSNSLPAPGGATEAMDLEGAALAAVPSGRPLPRAEAGK